MSFLMQSFNQPSSCEPSITSRTTPLPQEWVEWKYELLATAWGVPESWTPVELSEALRDCEENLLAVYLPEMMGNDNSSKAYFSYVPYDSSMLSENKLLCFELQCSTREQQSVSTLQHLICKPTSQHQA